MATTYAPNATTYAPNDFRPHNPFDDARRPASRGVVLALGVSLLVHGAIFAALWTAKFTAPLEVYSDQTTEVALLRAPPPPPSPPPELHLRRQAPPIVQPRPPLAPPVGIAAPPPLEIAPVVKPTPPPPAPPVVAVAVAPATVAPPARPAVIARPNWLRMPAAADVDRYYPERALRMGVTGKVMLRCMVTAKGAVDHCLVVSESPSDQDFGAASLKLSRLFAMSPETRDGQPVDGAQVLLPIQFTLPDG